MKGFEKEMDFFQFIKTQLSVEAVNKCKMSCLNLNLVFEDHNIAIYKIILPPQILLKVHL